MLVQYKGVQLKSKFQHTLVPDRLQHYRLAACASNTFRLLDFCLAKEKFSVLLKNCIIFLIYCILLGAFAILRRATVGFVTAVLLSVYPRGTPRHPLDGFSWNLIFEDFSKICWILVSLKYDKNNGYITWRPVHIYIFLNPHYEKFSDKISGEKTHVYGR